MAELITREDAIKYLCKNITWYDEDGNIADDDVKLDQITDIVYGIQGVEERKHGKWIEKLFEGKMICSCCNKDNKHNEYMDFCPNCGAEMRN